MASATYGGTTVESNDSTSEELAADLQPVEAAADAPASSGTQANEDAEASRAEPKPKPRSDPQARVQNATAKEATAKRERDEARAESAQLRARLDALERPKPAPDAEKPVEKVADWKRFRALPDAPKLADFDGPEALEDHAAAMADFVATKRYEESRRVETQATERTKAEESESKHYNGFKAKLKAASDEDPSFVDRIDPLLTETDRIGAMHRDTNGQFYVYRPNASGVFTRMDVNPPVFKNWLVEQIYRSEPVKELLEYFNDDIASGRKEFQRLAALHPDQAIREFARIEARLTPAAATLRSGTAPEAKESKAKPPIRPERGSSQVGNDEPPGDDASEATYEAYWGPRRAKLRHA